MNRPGKTCDVRWGVWLAAVGVLLAPGAARAAPALDLERTTVCGSTLLYEKALAGAVPHLREQYAAFLAADGPALARIDALRAGADRLLADVNRLLGAEPDAEAAALQRRILLAGLQPPVRWGDDAGRVTFHLVRAATIKDHMRRGGALPNCTYDAATDTVSFGLHIETTGQAPDGPVDLLIPVGLRGRDAAPSIDGLFEALEQMRPHPGVATHELVEHTILNVRLRARAPHVRWFSGGMARAMTVRLLETRLGREAADAFATGHDPAPHAALERDCNLRWWLSEDLEVETPFEAEDALHRARVAFATREAAHLLDVGGATVVDRVADRLGPGPLEDAETLLDVLRTVTGEDMRARLARYQGFETREAGLKRYRAAMAAALVEDDYAAALAALLRVRELEADLWPHYRQVAWYLLKLGRPELGLRALGGGAAAARNRAMDGRLLGMRAETCDFALRAGRPALADDVAETVLADEPYFLPALAVRMDRLRRDGTLREAAGIAVLILKTAPVSSLHLRRPAERALAAAREAARAEAAEAPTP